MSYIRKLLALEASAVTGHMHSWYLVSISTGLPVVLSYFL
jgi:hypothetical protein